MNRCNTTVSIATLLLVLSLPFSMAGAEEERIPATASLDLFDEFIASEAERVSSRKQINASTIGDNTNAVVERSSVSDFLGVAANLSGISEGAASGGKANSVSATVSLFSLASALTGTSPNDSEFYNRQLNRQLRNFAFTLGYDAPESSPQREAKIVGFKWRVYGDASKSDDRVMKIPFVEGFRPTLTINALRAASPAMWLFEPQGVPSERLLAEYLHELLMAQVDANDYSESNGRSFDANLTALHSLDKSKADEVYKRMQDKKNGQAVSCGGDSSDPGLNAKLASLRRTNACKPDKAVQDEVPGHHYVTTILCKGAARAPIEEAPGKDPTSLARATKAWVSGERESAFNYLRKHIQETMDGKSAAERADLDESAARLINEINKRSELALNFMSKLRDGPENNKYTVDFVGEATPFHHRNDIFGQLNVTVNAGLEYEEVLSGSDNMVLRAAVELQLPLSLGPYTPSIADMRPEISFGGFGRWFEEAGDQYQGQAKLTLHLLQGISLPLSFTVANRSELIDELETKGMVGFTIDTAALAGIARSSLVP